MSCSRSLREQSPFRLVVKLLEGFFRRKPQHFFYLRKIDECRLPDRLHCKEEHHLGNPFDLVRSRTRKTRYLDIATRLLFYLPNSSLLPCLFSDELPFGQRPIIVS